MVWLLCTTATRGDFFIQSALSPTFSPHCNLLLSPSSNPLFSSMQCSTSTRFIDYQDQIESEKVGNFLEGRFLEVTLCTLYTYSQRSRVKPHSHADETSWQSHADYSSVFLRRIPRRNFGNGKWTKVLTSQGRQDEHLILYCAELKKNTKSQKEGIKEESPPKFPRVWEIIALLLRLLRAGAVTAF